MDVWDGGSGRGALSSDPGSASETARVLSGLFPPTVGVGLGPVGCAPAFPYPAEEAAIAAAVPARRREFLAGRACAHVALRAIDRDGAAVGRGARREPVWPPGVVGSIAHAGNLAGAVAARAADTWGLGLDIELLDPPLGAAVERVVLRPGELARSAPAHSLAPYRAKIAFSAKECVYKCLFPHTRWSLDLQDVEVGIDLEDGRFSAVVDDRFRLGGLPLRRLEGKFAVAGAYLLSGLWVPPGGPVGESAATADTRGVGPPQVTA